MIINGIASLGRFREVIKTRLEESGYNVELLTCSIELSGEHNISYKTVFIGRDRKALGGPVGSDEGSIYSVAYGNKIAEVVYELLNNKDI